MYVWQLDKCLAYNKFLIITVALIALINEFCGSFVVSLDFEGTPHSWRNLSSPIANRFLWPNRW